MRQKKEVVVKSLVFKGNNNELFYYKNLLSNRSLQLVLTRENEAMFLCNIMSHRRFLLRTPFRNLCTDMW